jgi:hypothetical protein
MDLRNLVTRSIQAFRYVLDPNTDLTPPSRAVHMADVERQLADLQQKLSERESQLHAKDEQIAQLQEQLTA